MTSSILVSDVPLGGGDIASTVFQMLEKDPSLQTVAGARAWLDLLCSILDLLLLFQRTFPDDFRLAQEQGLSLVPADEASYSPYEIRFFELVDERLFPLSLDYWLDSFFEERLLTSFIPVEPQGMDLTADDWYIDDLSLGWQFICYLIGLEDETQFRQDHSEYEALGIFSVVIDRSDCRSDLLFSRLQAQGGPLACLPQVIQMLSNETESLWLNVTRDEPFDRAWWNDEYIEMLRSHYQLALDIRAKAEHFCDWLEERPYERFKLVVRLWNTCVRDTPILDNQERTRIVL